MTEIEMTPAKSMRIGALRFALVSVLAFGIWAFGGKMPTAALYGSIAVAFVALSGLFLQRLVHGPNPLRRFYAVFVPAFLLYAALWCAGWFGIGWEQGEILGSAAGLAAFTLVMTLSFKSKGAFLTSFAVLFLFHTLGYTLGGMFYYSSYGNGLIASVMEDQFTLGRLLWGLLYGLGFGAGLGYAFHRCQERRE